MQFGIAQKRKLRFRFVSALTFHYLCLYLHAMNHRMLITIVALLLLPMQGKSDFFCKKHDFASTYTLMQNHISNAVQDSAGFMWFSTWNGLIRFDGYNFHTFKPILYSDGTIYSNRIYNIKTNSTRNLWCISSDNRLFSFNPSTCKFTDIQKLIPIVNEKKVKTITPLPNGATWVTFKDFSCLRLLDITPENNYVYFAAGSDSLRNCKKIHVITYDSEGNEWILTDSGAINWNRSQQIPGNFHHIYKMAGYTILATSDGAITKIDTQGDTENYTTLASKGVKVTYMLQTGNRLIAATDRGVWSINISDGNLLHYTSLPAIYLFQDSSHRIWAFGKDNTVALIPNITKEEVLLLTTAFAPASEPMRNPQLIFEDNRNNIILKPSEGVLSYYDEASNTLKECRFYDDDDKTEIYAPNTIKKYLIDHDKNLWIFRPGSVDCISFRPDLFIHWENGYEQETRAILSDASGRRWIANRTNILTLIDSQNNIIGNIMKDGRLDCKNVPFSQMPIYCIKESPNHDIWMGTKGDGVYLLQPLNSSRNRFRITHFKHKTNDTTSLKSDTIYDIAFYEDRILLASYGNGLSEGIQTDTGWHFSQIGNQPEGMKVRNIFDAGDGILLMGTANGLVSVNLLDSLPRFYTNKYRQEDWGLKGNDIMSIIKCQGNYYVCVYGSGISRIDSDNLLSDSLHFTNYLIPSTETADQIKTAITDGKHIWIVSEQSLTRFSSETGQYNTYTHADFIGRFNFSEATPVIENNRITVGTSDGLLSFSCGDIAKYTQQKQIVITGIRYQNDISIQPLYDISTLTLSPERRSFSIYMSSMDYDEQNSSRFRYRMEGYDEGWNYVSGHPAAATYNNLPAGNYSLAIETADNKGNWQTPSRTIKIEVVPKFIETPGFKILLVGLFIAVIAGMLYAIIYFKQMRNLVQNKYSLLMTIDRLSKDYTNTSNKQETDKEEKDRLFIEKSVAFLNENISNSTLLVEDLAQHLGMSRTAYYNKMKQLTGLSPVNFIKQMRIKQALKFLEDDTLSISEIAYMVGFTDPKYFSRSFKAEMDMTPTQYIEKKKSEGKPT